MVNLTEGWLAGLQIIGFLLRGHPCPTEILQEVSGDHSHLLDFLTEEVIQQQPPIIQNFLLRTAILDQLTGPLCDAVTEQEHGQHFLEALARGNGFLFALDRQRRWYRYHPLFVQALRALLNRMHPDLPVTLHLRASSWYAEHGSLSEAIQHALSAGAREYASNLIHQDAITQPTVATCEKVPTTGGCWPGQLADTGISADSRSSAVKDATTPLNCEPIVLSHNTPVHPLPIERTKQATTPKHAQPLIDR